MVQFVGYATFAVLLVMYTLYKVWREQGLNQSAHCTALCIQSDDEKEHVGEFDGEKGHVKREPDYLQCGYTNDLFGTFMYYGAIFFSGWWLFALCWLTLDYYGLALGGLKTNRIFYQDNQRAVVFVFTWGVAVVWYLSLKVLAKKLTTFFIIRTNLENASVVVVEQKEDKELFLQGRHKSVQIALLLKGWMQKYIVGDRIQHVMNIRQSQEGTRFYEFQCTRYAYYQESNSFEEIKVELPSKHTDIHAACQQGLHDEDIKWRLERVGPNFIQVHVPRFMIALGRELATPFYFYQLMTLITWYYFAYWNMALVITCVILLSALVKIYVSNKSQRRIKEMAEHNDHCTVKRLGKWGKVETKDLVPGDVLLIEPDAKLPCDAILVSGEVLMDESMLTGESMPVQKSGIKRDQLVYSAESGKKNTLYSGTNVLDVPDGQTIRGNDTSDSEVKGAVAMVSHTGITTSKGQLIRSILFPKGLAFVFDVEFHLIGVILLLWAIIVGVIAINFIGNTTITAFFYAIATMSQILSPLLPAVMVIGQTVTSSRLARQHIYCLDLSRITITGKLKIFCFDKTGTLTQEGLQFHGVQSIQIAENGTEAVFDSVREDLSLVNNVLLDGMSVAHTVSELNGSLVGNPVDVEIMRVVDGQLELSSEGRRVRRRDRLLQVVRIFEFDHHKMRMCVIVRDLATNDVHVFCKGSFEIIKLLSDEVSVPADFDEMTAAHAMQGCYTLGFAHQNLGHLDDATIHKMTRDEFEEGLRAIGLILFQNKLKPDTAEAIAELKRGYVRPVMITGDTALTGVFIARAAGLTQSDRVPILLGDIGPQGLFWKNVDTGREIDVDYLIRHLDQAAELLSDLPAAARPLSPTKEESDETLLDNSSVSSDFSVPVTMPESAPFELAVTGAAYNELCRSKRIRSYLLFTRVFARMTPKDKVTCIQLHMEKAVTGMCGDGGNDCGALRAAHVGLALSDAEASIVSPFSSKNRSIFSCVELLRQGRCALSTSFSAYKFVILYGEILVLSKLVCYYMSVLPSELFWIFLDSIIVILVSWSLTQAQPHPKLSTSRPTSRLLGLETVSSILGTIFLHLLFNILLLVWFFNTPFFNCKEFESNLISAEKWWLMGDNYEAMLVGFFILWQVLTAGFTLNLGYHFRQSWYRNLRFLFVYSAITIIIVVAFVLDPNPLGCTFRWNCGNPDDLTRLGYSPVNMRIEKYNNPAGNNVIPLSLRLQVLGIFVASFICQWAYQGLVVYGPVRSSLRVKKPLQRIKLIL
jgi:cation-transporting ATPase 13A3/4/5